MKKRNRTVLSNAAVEVYLLKLFLYSSTIWFPPTKERTVK